MPARSRWLLSALACVVGPALGSPAQAEEHRWLFNQRAEADQRLSDSDPVGVDGAVDHPIPFEPDWRFRIEPSAWFAGPAGEVQLPGSGLTLDFGDLNLDSTAIRPMAEAHLRNGPWRVTLRGFTVDEEGTTTATFSGALGNVAFSTGDVLRAEVSMASVELEGSYRFEPFVMGRRSDGAPVDLDSWFEVIAGARVHTFDFDFAVEGGASQGESRVFGEPLVGLRWNLEIDKDFSIDVMGTIGGFAIDDNTYSVSADVIAGGTWRITPNAGIQIGYRQLASFYGDGEGADEFVGQGSTAGLYFGADFRF